MPSLKALTRSQREFAGQLSSYAGVAPEYGPYRGRVRYLVKRSVDRDEWCIRPCNQDAWWAVQIYSSFKRGNEPTNPYRGAIVGGCH
jgi:hypothetical protein